MLQQSGVGIAITGSGSATPALSVENDGLTALVETSDEWISSRTGIKARHLAQQETVVSLAQEAAQKAISMAGLQPSEIDLIILATSTADDLFGSASFLQSQLGATQAVAFDLTAACSGFVFAMVTAAQYLRSGVYRNAVVVGADVLSRWVDWRDRTTCVLFGDGAGAVVMQASPTDHLLGFELRSDGSLNHCLNLSFAGEAKTLTPDLSISQGNYQFITMNGKEVYRFAVNKVPEVIEKALFRAHLTVDQIDWLLLHQANQRILDAVAQRLQVPPERVLSNLAHYGNTSAASIPLALDEAVRQGKVKAGETIAASGFGAGLTWGSVIFRWGRP